MFPTCNPKPTDDSIERMTEILALNRTVIRLWPAGSLAIVDKHFNCASLTYAFMTAQRIAEIGDQLPNLTARLGMLNLCQVDTSGARDGNNWAAAFDTNCNDFDEWYEADNPGKLRYFARASTPAIAITRAAALVVPVYLELVRKEQAKNQRGTQ